METPDIEVITGRRPSRWLVLLVLLAVAGLGAFLAYWLLLAGGGSEEEAFNTHRVTTGTIRSTVTVSGVAEAVEQTNLSFGIAGRVASIEVKLGQEVTAGQALARLESDDLQNQLDTAESNLASARIRLQQIQKGPTAAEIAAAENAVVTAQVALDKALNAQKDLLDGPSEAELASAEKAVESAQAALLAAREDLRKLQEGPSEADLAAANASVATAQASLTAAENGLATAKAGVRAAETALQAAGTTYCDTEDHLRSICKDFDIPLSSREVRELTDSIESDGSTPEPALVAATTALVEANLAYIKAVAAVDDAEETLTSAQAGLQSTQEALDALTAGPEQSELEAAQAAVTSAEQTLEAAQLSLDELREGPTASDIANAQGAVDSARANLASATAARDELLAGATQEDIDLQVQQVRLAELAVEKARRDLADSTLTAPFDGVVAAIDINVGDVVSPATPAVALLTPNALRLKLTLGETDLPSVKIGQSGLFIFDAIQGVPYQITISKIGLEPETSQGVVTYTAEADLTGLDTDAEPRPAPGMNGAAVIVTGEKTDVLTVPSRAIRRKGDNLTVEVVIDGKTETRVVQTGVSDAEKTEIISGLKAGDRVVLPGAGPATGEAEQKQGEEIPAGIR